MKLYLSKTHADQDGPMAEEGRLGILYTSKENFLKMCDFFEEVKHQLQDKDDIHMHFRDFHENWDGGQHIDLEVNIKSS